MASGAIAKRKKENRTGAGLGGAAIGKWIHAAKRTTASKAATAKGRRIGAAKRSRVTKTKRG